ncbi:MAG: hypothetical protein J5959_19080 [Butyrivibrio sp.]|nr:hypothetical protein [Butyrivibrio sp.]
MNIAKEKDGRMVLKNVNDDLYDVLKLSSFVDFLEIERLSAPMKKT